MEIEEFDVILENAVAIFSKKYKRTIGRKDIFNALFLLLDERGNFEHLGDLWDITYSQNEILSLLDQFDFSILEQKIEVAQISPSGFFGRKVRIKAKGEVWYIYKYDKDPFPSNPHAHNLESNLKMDLSNGKLYHKRDYVDKVPRKEFLEFRNLVERKCNVNLPVLNLNH